MSDKLLSIGNLDGNKISYGGKSSSDILNNINSNFINDLISISSDIKDLEDQHDKLSSACAYSSSAIAAEQTRLISSISLLRDMLVENGTLYLDMYDTGYLSGDCGIDPSFGQVTLPITGEYDWLVSRTGVPLRGAAISYSLNSDGHIPAKNEYTAVSDTSAIDSTPGTLWYTQTQYTDAFIRVDSPGAQVASSLANAVIIKPFPPLMNDLVSVDIVSQTGSTYSADLSIIPGYSNVSGHVERFADTRIFFPGTAVSYIIIHLKTPLGIFGFSDIALKTYTFKSIGNLIIDPRSISNSKAVTGVTLNGDTYGTSVNIEDTITVNISQYAAGTTPLIISAVLTF